ncbi:MAG: ABC-2 transporter permease [Lachnospiraceae bacterium]
MKGLLLKDFYVIKDAMLIQLIMLSVIGVGMSFIIAPSVFIVMSAVVFSLFSSTIIIHDKTSKWDMFATTLPIPNTQVIRSNYIVSTLLIALGLLLGVLVATVLGEFNFERIFQHILIGAAMSLSSLSVSIPLSILFDDKKQVIAIVLSFVIPVIVFAVAIFATSEFTGLQENMTSLLYMVFGIGLIMFITSWVIAPKLLSNRKL